MNTRDWQWTMSSAGPGEALQMAAAPRSRRLYEQVVETIPAYQFVVGRTSASRHRTKPLSREGLAARSGDYVCRSNSLNERR